ncbi:MAG: flagellar basal body rod protein FlgC [Nitrospinota bacterium]
MTFFDAIESSADGLRLNRMRMNVIASNLSNANTTRTAEGGPYRRKEVVVESGYGYAQSKVGIKIDVVEDKSAFRMIYDPTHPDSTEDGYLLLPNVNPIEEMVNMLNASRGFELNSLAIKTAKQMAQKAIEIGQS